MLGSSCCRRRSRRPAGRNSPDHLDLDTADLDTAGRGTGLVAAQSSDLAVDLAVDPAASSALGASSFLRSWHYLPGVSLAMG